MQITKPFTIEPKDSRARLFFKQRAHKDIWKNLTNYQQKRWTGRVNRKIISVPRHWEIASALHLIFQYFLSSVAKKKKKIQSNKTKRERHSSYFNSQSFSNSFFVRGALDLRLETRSNREDFSWPTKGRTTKIHQQQQWTFHNTYSSILRPCSLSTLIESAACNSQIGCLRMRSN
jgi:hypothetical protein